MFALPHVGHLVIAVLSAVMTSSLIWVSFVRFMLITCMIGCLVVVW
jgi:hypothetical protein